MGVVGKSIEDNDEDDELGEVGTSSLTFGSKMSFKSMTSLEPPLVLFVVVVDLLFVLVLVPTEPWQLPLRRSILPFAFSFSRASTSTGLFELLLRIRRRGMILVGELGLNTILFAGYFRWNFVKDTRIWSSSL